MSITLPNLDDREFTDLVAEAKGMIPQLAPSWTDHNPSDPGITLIELFASICEMLMYRANRITEANKLVFLQLLMGKQWLANHRETLSTDRLIATAIAELRREERAISNADFENFALEAGTSIGQKEGPIARAYCRTKRNYELSPPFGQFPDAPGHVSLVIIPHDNPCDPVSVTRDNGWAKMVKDYIEPRRLLTTKLHVVPATYLPIGINLQLTIFEDYKEADVKHQALLALRDYFHPLNGGLDGNGWKLGDPVYLTKIFALLDQLPGIDYVEQVPGKNALVVVKDAASLPVGRLIPITGTPAMCGLKLFENELPQFEAGTERQVNTLGDLIIIKPSK